jgi:hemoglobin
MSDSDVVQPRSAFDLLGGQPIIDRLVDDFYDRMDSLPEARALRAMHAADLEPMRELLKKYMGEWLGGPSRYTSERGHPMLRARHLPFRIGLAERDAWMLCMNGALDAMPGEPEVREHIRTALANLADWMRNRPDEPPPGR